MGDGSGATEDPLVEAIDQTIDDAQSLLAALRAADGPRERRIAGQLAVAVAALVSTRGRLAQGRGDVPPEPAKR